MRNTSEGYVIELRVSAKHDVEQKLAFAIV